MESKIKSKDTPGTVRSRAILKSGCWFILTNFLLAVFNIVVGLLSNSLAIVSDAAHSLIDAVSGLIIIISEKLACHRKFTDYRLRIERFATIAIAIIIIVAGVQIIVEAIEKIFDPSQSLVDYDVPTIVVLVASIIAKYALAAYLKRQGQRYKSTVLTASSAETLNDAWISVAVLLSVAFYLIWRVDIEAYISLIIAVVIIKVGVEFIFPHLSRHHHHHLESNPDHDHCDK